MVDGKGTSTSNRKLRQNHHNIGRHRFICDKISKSVRLLDGKHAFIYRGTDDAYILGKKVRKNTHFDVSATHIPKTIQMETISPTV